MGGTRGIIDGGNYYKHSPMSAVQQVRDVYEDVGSVSSFAQRTTDRMDGKRVVFSTRLCPISGLTPTLAYAI